MKMQKQFSLGVAFFVTFSLTLLLIGSPKFLQAETSQTSVNSQLVIDKSGPSSVLRAEPITYTIAISNTTPNITLTRLYVTDTLPFGATYITGSNAFSETLIENNVLSWTIASLAAGEMISFSFAVTATETITNQAYRVVSAQGISATGQSAVVTIIRDEPVATPTPSVTATVTMTPSITSTPIPTITQSATPTVTASPTNSASLLHLPLILRQPTPTPTPTATPTVTFTPTPSCLTAEEEPNNRLSEADSHDPLCENTDVSGRFPNEEERDDIYVIESAGGTLTLMLTNIPAGADYDLELYRGTTRLDRSNNSGTQDEQISISLDAGKYYARVYRFKGSSPQPYVIRWQNE